MSNKHLTAKNETEVMALVTNSAAKQAWQAEAAQFGKGRAINTVATRFNVSASSVKAAAYYW